NWNHACTVPLTSEDSISGTDCGRGVCELWGGFGPSRCAYGLLDARSLAVRPRRHKRIVGGGSGVAICAGSRAGLGANLVTVNNHAPFSPDSRFLRLPPGR